MLSIGEKETLILIESVSKLKVVPPDKGLKFTIKGGMVLTPESKLVKVIACLRNSTPLLSTESILCRSITSKCATLSGIFGHVTLYVFNGKRACTLYWKGSPI